MSKTSRLSFWSFLIVVLFAVGTLHAQEFGHVVIVLGENTNATDADANATWIKALGDTYSHATQFYSVTHPSIGNYFAMTDGIIETNDDNQCPDTFIVAHDNIVRRMIAAGKTWKQYAENLPSIGYLGCDPIANGLFAIHHIPLPYYSDAQTTAQKLNIVPFTQFATDLANGTLPNYSFITPNMCNDAHDCPISTFDSWAQLHLGPLLTNSQFMKDGLLIITWDESADDNANGGGRVQFVMAGPTVKMAFASSTTHSLLDLCRLSAEGMGVTIPAGCTPAAAMSEFFGVAPPPVIAVTISPLTPTVAPGGTIQFHDTVTGTSNTAVVWSATSGSISSSGLFTAPSSPGTSTAKVSSVASGSASASTVVSTISTPPSGGVLVGVNSIEPTDDYNVNGMAQAWPVTASGSGTLSTMSFYDSSGTGGFAISLYADASGTPGLLLSKASFATTAGGWNTALASPPANVVAGTHYWLAMEALSGITTHFRDGGSACGSLGSSAGLSGTWATTANWATFGNCPASVYASGSAVVITPSLKVSCSNVGTTRVCSFTPANIPTGTTLSVTGTADGATASTSGPLP